ncbi:MAG TPA: serine/threonine-protein kinase, partial [Polyangiaceae bacterium]
MSLTTGEIIEGKYRIIRLIGEGGMGAVYEGENTRIRRRVAIKVLHQGVAENQEAVQRFEREAQAAGRIGNDHILEVLDLGSLANGDHFMVMEYLDGEPLSDRIRRIGKMRPEQIAPLMIQALEGLRAAHDAGIVHRDLKPDNVYILKEKAGNRDFVKLIDFGISKFQPLSGGEMKMTRTGTVMGTPYYMSPEQASGSREADHRSDLYAVGVMLYEAVTGRVPFDAPTFNQLLFQIVLSDPAPPQQVVPDLDPGFANLIAKAMARDVEHRFQTTQELSDALADWMKTGKSVSLPPTGPMNPLVRREAFGSAPDLNLGVSANAQAMRGTTTPDTWAQ